MGGSQERWGGRGVGFKIGGWEIFKVSLHSWQRSASPPILWRHLYIAYPSPFFKFCPFLLPPYFLSCFFGWMDDHTKFDVPFYLIIIMDLHMSSLGGTLVPEEPWRVFYAKSVKFNEAWPMWFFYWYSDLTSHTGKHTNTHSTLRGAVDWHTHINIYLHHLCAHSSYHCYIKWLNE